VSDTARSLRLDFATEAAFRGEYVSNIANGGVFVATNAGFAVRESVRVELALNWCKELISLDGEVVHVITPDMSSPTGESGVAIQFSLRASDLRERLAPVLARALTGGGQGSGPADRTARRARVRVPILMRTTDGREIEGRSCDLSTTGALVEIEGDPVPPGEVVQLGISNTTVGEEIEVHGTVMRHVARPGGRVDAAGVFLHELLVAEHSRRLGGISGPVAEIGIENVLQLFGACSQHGTLTLDHGGDEALVAFEHGMLRGVELGDTFGRKALARLLNWKTGTFEFNAKASPSLYRGDPVPLDAAILDALRLLDESRLSDPGAFPPTAKLYVDREKLAAAGRELSQAEEAILDLAAVGMSVGKVIDVIPEPDEEIRQQLGRLIERGLITLLD
jgi:Tfp pilus assembly protein PilZ